MCRGLACAVARSERHMECACYFLGGVVLSAAHLPARLAFVFQQPGTRFVVLAATTLRAIFRFGLLIAQIRDKCHRVRALQNIQPKIDIVFLFRRQHTQKILANDGSIGNTDLMVAPNFTQRMNAGISQSIDL